MLDKLGSVSGVGGCGGANPLEKILSSLLGGGCEGGSCGNSCAGGGCAGAGGQVLNQIAGLGF